MNEHQREYTVNQMCQVLDVSRSGYYAWRQRKPSRQAEANVVLLTEIKKVHQTSRQTYGSPRVHAALRRQGIACGRNRVARLMRAKDIKGKKRRRRYPVTTQRDQGAPAAPNLLNQEFTASRPNQKWVADITYIDTAEGWLYLAVVLDLCSRAVVGRAMADHMETSLVEDAFRMAVACRCPDPGFQHHSDQGSQYTSTSFQQCLKTFKCQVSMSRVGNCYDNAVMESFFATLKSDCVTGQFESRVQARTVIFEYLEVWYNRQRLHSSLGFFSPVEFELLHFSDIESVH